MQSLKNSKTILSCDWIIEICLYLIIFTSIFSKAAVGIFFGIAFIAYLLKKALSISEGHYRISSPVTKLDLPILAFISANIISTIFSQNFILSSKYFIKGFMVNVGLYFMAAEVILFQKKDKTKSFILAILAALTVLVIDGAFQYFSCKDIIWNCRMSGRRLTASLGSPNTLAAWLILVTPLSCCLGIMGKVKNFIRRVDLIILSCFSILCIFFTYSRGAWLGFLIGMFFIAVFKDRRIIVFLSVLIIFFSLRIYLYPNSLAEFNTEYVKYPILIRLNLWNEALRLIKDYPFFGVGLKNYLAIIPKYQIHQINLPISQIGETTGISPHNGYLQMAAETGLIGLACFIWILWALFKNGIKYLKTNPDPVLLGLLGGLLAFLASAFFDNHLKKVELSAMFWIMLTLAAALLKRQEQNRSNIPQ